jgi:hypothetical protein
MDVASGNNRYATSGYVYGTEPHALLTEVLSAGFNLGPRLPTPTKRSATNFMEHKQSIDEHGKDLPEIRN